MAKSVADLIVALEVKGIEGVSQLKGALRGLSKAAGPADKDLEQIRRSVTAFAKAGQLSRQSIAGQIEAFKGLRQQATIGSSVYRKLGKDIDGLTQSLDKLNRKEDEASKKPRSPKQIFGEGVAVIPEKFNKQIAAGNQILQSLSVTSQEYGQRLANVTIRTQEFTRAQQRQQVIAQSLVAANRAQTTGFLQSSKVNIQNTHTLSALKQRISELAQDVDNLDVGSKEYTSTSRLLKNAQEELNQVLGVSSRAFDDLTRAQERSERRARKLADTQQYYGTSKTPVGEMAQRAGGYRDPATGAMIARGTVSGRVSLAQQPVREISSLYQSIGSVGMAGISADIDRMGKSYGEVANDIKKATLASNGSINSLNAQRASWASLRAGLDPASKGYREVGREIDKVDKRLARLNKRRGFSAKGAAQTVGAVASAGIFGGPLGAAGALGGAAIGGAAGAAVGGGIGASVGVLAQQVSGFTDYAASIRLSEKALKRLVTVENDRIQTAKNEAVATQVIEYAVAKLNVERADATIGMTRLSAAVLGAGGNIETAGLAFLGATKAIKATKGSAEDVRGGLTALVQMFSKGRISAEELSGQLGERFPAAVTAFAEANDISTQELQKMLKNGEVGLDKLVNFLQFAVEKYSDGALEMAASSEESGQRQTIAFQEVRRQLGEQLVSVGSELQQSITKALKDLTPTIVALAKASAEAIAAIINGIALLIKHFDKIKDLILVIVGGAVGGKILALVTTISFKIVPLIKKVGLLRAAILILNRTLLLNPLFLLASGITAAGIAISNFTNRHSNFIDKIDSGALSVKEAKDELAKYRTELNKLETQKGIQDGTIQEIKPGNRGGIRPITPEDLRPSSGQPELLDSRIKTLKDTIKKGEASIKALEAGSNPLLGEGDFLANLLENSKIPGLDIDPSGGSGSGSKGPTDISDLQLQARLAARIAARTDATIEQRKKALMLERESAVLASEELDTNKQIDAVHKAADDFRKGMLKIEKDVTAEQEKQLKATVALNAARMQLQAQLGLTTKQEQVKTAQDSFKQKHPGATDEDLDLIRQTIDPTLFEQGTAQIRAMREELAQMVNPINQVTGAANAIGSAFTDSFRSVIDGSATTQEALAGFFKNIGNYFLDMAMRIIQKMIEMAILNTIVGLLPGLGGGGGGGGGDIFSAIAGRGGLRMAKGGAFAKNKIVPYAKGGIVNKPTMFAYANGGAGRFGIMGEAGPEAIMPLRRGANGKLGVESSGGGVGNVVVNVDASGSSVEGDGDQAAQLGKMLGAAVQTELIKQKRPGGLLSS